MPPDDDVYGLNVNEWVLDYIYYGVRRHEQSVSRRMVSFGVVPGQQVPTTIPLATTEDFNENDQATIALTALEYAYDSPETSTLHAHILSLP